MASRPLRCTELLWAQRCWRGLREYCTDPSRMTELGADCEVSHERPEPIRDLHGCVGSWVHCPPNIRYAQPEQQARGKSVSLNNVRGGCVRNDLCTIWPYLLSSAVVDILRSACTCDVFVATGSLAHEAWRDPAVCSASRFDGPCYSHNLLIVCELA